MKIRIDEYLVKHKLAPDITTARGLIMSGKVLVDDIVFDKQGMMINLKKKSHVRIKSKTKYVSRAGEKLEIIIKKLNLDFSDKIVLDIGSSTGGFTHCALKYNAQCVYALDVGTNQLSYELRIDPRVKVYEQTNFRTISEDFFKQKFDVILMDVSFISVSLLVENVVKFLDKNAKFICLIKPQFEADKKEVDASKGIIIDTKIHKRIINNLAYDFAQYNLHINYIMPCEIKGRYGNVEYICMCEYQNKDFDLQSFLELL